MVNTSEANPTTWLDRLQTDEASDKLNSIHEDVVDLFKINDATPTDDDSRTKMLDRITKITTNAVLTQSPVNGEMMLLHQISTVGGDILNKTQEYFGLFGSGNAAIAMNFNPATLLHPNEVECPSWATLSKVTTENGVQAVRNLNATPHFMTSGLSIPPSSQSNSLTSPPPPQPKSL